MPATYEDVLNAPETVVAEIIDGELCTTPIYHGRQERAASGIFRAVSSLDYETHEWWIAWRPELPFNADVLVPALAAWRRQRVPQHAHDRWEDVPDWICEVLSPTARAFDSRRKLLIYARHGVQRAWLCDPAEKLLEVYRRVDRWFALVAAYSGDDVIRAEPFDAVDFPLSRLWLPTA